MVVVALAVLPLVVSLVVEAKRDFLLDFSAFYCAGRAAIEGRSPYEIEPLRTCEHLTGPALRVTNNSSLVLPVPLPGYAIAGIRPIALLPFSLASVFWLIGLFGACILSVIVLARVTGSEWESVAAALSLSLATISITLGQVVPFAFLAICLCAYFAASGRWQIASIAAIGSMVEPHLGIALCISIFAWIPSCRWTILTSLSALGLLSILTLGPDQAYLYLAQVLPAHSLSEAGFSEQYSVTSILAYLGLADIEAVRIGSAWFAVMVVLGVVVAGSIWKKTRDAAALVLVPPAFSVFGGVFVHVTQISIAVAPALWLVAREKKGRQIAATVAMLLLVFPWKVSYSPAAILAPAFPIGYLAWIYFKRNVRAAILTGCIAGFLIVTINGGYARDHRSHSHYTGTSINARLPEAPWSEYIRANRTPTVATLVAHLPTWVGLFLLLSLLSTYATEMNTASEKDATQPDNRRSLTTHDYSFSRYRRARLRGSRAVDS